VTNNFQQADTGTKMIHLKTLNRPLFPKVSAGRSQNSYRGLVRISPNADNARNFSQCDSLLMGDNCGAHTFPYIESKIHRLKLNTKQQQVKLAKTKFSIVTNVESLPKSNCFNRKWFQ
jgi:Fe-S cluster assembly protein SufB